MNLGLKSDVWAKSVEKTGKKQLHRETRENSGLIENVLLLQNVQSNDQVHQTMGGTDIGILVFRAREVKMSNISSNIRHPRVSAINELSLVPLDPKSKEERGRPSSLN